MAVNAQTPMQKHQVTQMYNSEMRAFIAMKRREGLTAREIATVLQVSEGTVRKYMKQSLERTKDLAAAGIDVSDTTPKPRTEEEVRLQRPGFKVKKGAGAGPHRAKSPKAPPPAVTGSSPLSPTAPLVVSGTVLLPDVELEFQKKVWNYRKHLIPFDQIARKLGRSEADCRQAIRLRYEQLDAEELQSTDYVRKQMIEQIDAQISAIFPRATGEDAEGNPVRIEYEAIDRVVKLMKSKADLLGLNAPTKVDITLRLKQLAEDFGYSYDDLKGIAAEVLSSYNPSRSLGGR